jgi:hypothetical protein
VILTAFTAVGFGQITIDQKLTVFSNSGIIGGSFSIEYKLKGSQLTDSKTLGSLCADINYDSNRIRYTGATNWNDGLSQAKGYEKFVSNNYNSLSAANSFLRIMINGLNVNGDSLSSQQGFSLENGYSTVVRLNFVILDNTNSVSLTINQATNQVGLFANPGNNPNTFEIYDHILAAPQVIDNEALPVMITEFSSYIKTDNVTLKWITASERNNEGFRIERKNIKSENPVWINVGTVKGAGNSNTATRYSFEDTKVQSGKYNYRIRQVDNNGNYKYFNLISVVEIGVPSKYNLSQNYPNPFNPTTKINYELPKDSKVNISVFDILGREVMSLVNQEQKAGYYSITTDAKNLASGTYFYRLIAKSTEKDYVMSKKMCVVK